MEISFLIGDLQTPIGDLKLPIGDFKSPIGDLKSPIRDLTSPSGDNISNWRMGIYDYNKVEPENKSPIPNGIIYH